jgi:hypothetical protein
MNRIIILKWNPPVVENNISFIKNIKWVTNTETLDEAIEQIRLEGEKWINKKGGEIISITEDNT